MKNIDLQDLLTAIYSQWDLVTDQEKEYITSMDDKLNEFWSLSSTEAKELKRILKELRNRNK